MISTPQIVYLQVLVLWLVHPTLSLIINWFFFPGLRSNFIKAGVLLVHLLVCNIVGDSVICSLHRPSFVVIIIISNLAFVRCLNSLSPATFSVGLISFLTRCPAAVRSEKMMLGFRGLMLWWLPVCLQMSLLFGPAQVRFFFRGWWTPTLMSCYILTTRAFQSFSDCLFAVLHCALIHTLYLPLLTSTTTRSVGSAPPVSPRDASRSSSLYSLCPIPPGEPWITTLLLGIILTHPLLFPLSDPVPVGVHISCCSEFRPWGTSCLSFCSVMCYLFMPVFGFISL